MLKAKDWMAMSKTDRQIYIITQAIKAHRKRKRPVRQHESINTLSVVIISQK